MKDLSTFLSLLLMPLVAVMPLQAEMAAATASAVSSVEATVPSASTNATGQATGQTNALQIRLANAGNAAVEASSSLQGYAIQVNDSSGLPVADAAVAIRLPEDGATGFFADGAHSAVAYTNASGIATFSQINWSSTLGTASIRVTAVKGELHSGALIEQNIVAHSAAIPQKKAEAVKIAPPTPGTPATVAAVNTGSAPEQTTTRTAATPAPEPVVSIVNSGGSHAGSNKKWIVLAAVVAAAGVGTALALSGKGAATVASSTTGLTIGTPTVSVGH